MAYLFLGAGLLPIVMLAAGAGSGWTQKTLATGRASGRTPGIELTKGTTFEQAHHRGRARSRSYDSPASRASGLAYSWATLLPDRGNIGPMDPKNIAKSSNLGLGSLDNLLYLTRNFEAERQYEIIRSIRSAPQRHAESVQEAVLAHIKELQDKLGPEEELQVTCYLGPEVVRVRQVGMPNWHVLILGGLDRDDNSTSVIMDMHTVQMVCRVVKVEPPRKPVRIGFILPEPEEKQESKTE